MKRIIIYSIIALIIAVPQLTAKEDIKYKVKSSKNVEQAVEDFKETAKNHGFGTLTVHDMKATLKKKGFDLENEVVVLEICNPGYAFKVLNEDIDLNMALPCRVSIYTVGGQTIIGMVRPTAMLSALSDSEKLAEIAKEVEDKIIKIIDEVK